MAGKKRKVTKLEDLLVEEVSVVDRPANQRRFLMVKSEANKGEEIQVDADGNLVTGDAANTDETPIDFAEVFKSTGEGFALLEKRLTIDPDIRREMFRNIGDTMSRLSSVLNSADFAQSDRDGSKGESTLVPILAAEVEAVAKELAAMAKFLKKGKVTKSDDDPDEGADEGLTGLLTSLVETVEKRGAKMSKARLAAFKSATDTLQSILDELNNITKAAAVAHSHTFVVEGKTVTTAPATVADGKAHTHTVSAAFKKLTTSSGPGGPGHTHTVSVAGKTIKGSGPTVPKEKPKGNPFAKSEDDEPSENETKLLKSLEAMTVTLAARDVTVKKQAKDLRELRQARPGSNSVPVEKGSGDGLPGNDDEVAWPMDLNS